MKHEHFISNEDSKFSNTGELKMYLPHFMVRWNCHLLYLSLIPPDLVLVSPIPSELVSDPVFNIHQFTVHIHCCTERPFKRFQFIPTEADRGKCAVCHRMQFVAIRKINVMPKSC
jgi:hypothetical protein